MDGVQISPRTVVGCAAYTLHHDPDVFPEPFAFRPGRWLQHEKETHIGKKNLDGAVDGEGLYRPEIVSSMLPFGAGSRACIGKTLAQQQLYEAVIALVDSEVMEDGAKTVQKRVEMKEWFNGEINCHKLEVEWGCG